MVLGGIRSGAPAGGPDAPSLKSGAGLRPETRVWFTRHAPTHNGAPDTRRHRVRRGPGHAVGQVTAHARGENAKRAAQRQLGMPFKQIQAAMMHDVRVLPNSRTHTHNKSANDATTAAGIWGRRHSGTQGEDNDANVRGPHRNIAYIVAAALPGGLGRHGAAYPPSDQAPLYFATMAARRIRDERRGPGRRCYRYQLQCPQVGRRPRDAPLSMGTERRSTFRERSGVATRRGCVASWRKSRRPPRSPAARGNTPNLRAQAIRTARRRATSHRGHRESPPPRRRTIHTSEPEDHFQVVAIEAARADAQRSRAPGSGPTSTGRENPRWATLKGRPAACHHGVAPLIRKSWTGSPPQHQSGCRPTCSTLHGH